MISSESITILHRAGEGWCVTVSATIVTIFFFSTTAAFYFILLLSSTTSLRTFPKLLENWPDDALDTLVGTLVKLQNCAKINKRYCTESILSMVHRKVDPPLLRLHNFAVFPHVFKPICVSFDELFYNSSIQFVYLCPLYEDIKFVFHIFSKSLHMFARQNLTPNVLWKLKSQERLWFSLENKKRLLQLW